ncbi:conserved Plasmodium protein, unknown function [Plasmodium chabaudi chabaudi]|uniref:Uncharacterized protein n=1 Tax=Plasmodium chabaudi chabaudi TaxID=31271 RepID=A0A4V0K6U7_PLACU|nr:conserved Plasmodium protein, unknown function [Plasmodium chabaudi chabaudi]VTZ68775.1 conserved Plasmodium protein, unknown function [Plasmodium chabaudi chabaudi]|eukprot:XP_016655363.1 conserved Plasmodium protein, unknown function [Plasmodium chabaudi chabaudi]
MWIEKEIKENHTHGGALSKQVNDDIELLKKSNKFLYENGNRNLFCESMKRDCNESLRACSTIDFDKSFDESKKMNTSLLVSGYFRDKVSKKHTNKLINSGRQNVHNEEYRTDDKYKVEQLKKKKKNNNETVYGNMQTNRNTNYKNSQISDENKTISYQSNVKINREDLDEFFNTAGVNNVRKRNEFSFGKTDHRMFGEKHSNSLENKNKKIYNLNGSTYKNTQYLNNSHIYNDSIVNNNTVLYKEYNSIKNARAFEKELDINESNIEENNLTIHKTNKYPTLTNSKKAYTEICDMSPQKCVDKFNKEITEMVSQRKENNNSQNELLKVKNFICKGVPNIIRNSANNCFPTNVDINVQNKIEKHIMDFLENNLVNILEKKNLSCFEGDNNISDKISESINLEIKKNIDKAYKNINENMNINMNDEIKKNVDILNTSLSENINSKIKNNIEELYDKLNENVLESISNNMENNLYKNVNNELKRKIDIVEKRIDINVNDNINKELEKKIIFLNDQINENISKELKKYISILSRNIDEYLSDHMEKNTKIMSKNLGVNLGEEIKNNITIMEKNIDYNLNEENIQRNFKKIYEMYNMSTIEDIKRVIANSKDYQNQNDLGDIKNSLNIMMDKMNTENITEELKMNLQMFGNKIDEKFSILNENQLNHHNHNSKEVIESVETRLTHFAKEIEKNNFQLFDTSVKDTLQNYAKTDNEKIEKNIINCVKNTLDEQTQKLSSELKCFNKLQINKKDIIDNIKNSLLPFQQNVTNSLEGNTIELNNINDTVLKMITENKLELNKIINNVLDKIEMNFSNKLNEKAKEISTKIDEVVLEKVSNIEENLNIIKKKMNDTISQMNEINLQMLSIPNEDKINKIIIDFNKKEDKKFGETKEIIKENRIQITSTLVEQLKRSKTDSKIEFKKVLQNIFDINTRNFEQNRKIIHNLNLIPQSSSLLNGQSHKETKTNVDVKDKNKINLYKQYKKHFNSEKITPNKLNKINREKRKPIYIVNYMKNDNNDLIEVSNYLKKRTIRKVYL